MRRAARWIRGHQMASTALAAVVVSAGLVGGMAASAPGSLPPNAAFEVDGEVMSVADFERRVAVLKVVYGVEEPPASDPKRRDAFRRDAAQAMVVGEVLERAARAMGVNVADRKAREALDRFVAESYRDGRTGFVRALGDQGVAEDEVLTEIRRQLVTRRLFDEVVGEVEVSDEEVVTAYEKRKEQLAEPERRQIRHIVLESEAAARQVLANLAGGAPFVEEAKRSSLDGSTRDNGGDLGLVAAAQLVPAFREAAFAALPGQPFGPVKTDLGWHVGLVEQIQPARSRALDEVRDDLREQLRAEKALERWRRWIRERVGEADVRYAPRYRPADPDKPPSFSPVAGGPDPQPEPGSPR